jgi:hypothetical protein
MIEKECEDPLVKKILGKELYFIMFPTQSLDLGLIRCKKL